MVRVALVAIVAAASNIGLSLGLLTGSGTITYHDYQAIPAALVVNNPPSCGMPYAQLDVTRITAVQQLNKATDCGQCIKVTNANDPSKFVYVLAVDTGGRGLDLSKPSFGKLFDIDDGVGPAMWAPADNSNCAGIWSNAPPPPPVVQPPPPPPPPVVQPPPPTPPPVVQPHPPTPPPVVQPPPPSSPAVVQPPPPSPPPVVLPPPPSPPPAVVNPSTPPPVAPRSVSSSSPALSTAPQTSLTRSSPADVVPQQPQPPAVSSSSDTYQGSSTGPGTSESFPGGIGHNGESDVSSDSSSDAQTSEDSSSELSSSQSNSATRYFPSAVLAVLAAAVLSLA
ncbi:hypothetical protein GGI21_004992 [Coemansia aciculifera]|nr:hypothetical protein GGI21_004992 [Coemansia aciculifera]